MKIYISGPISGIADGNRYAFEDAEAAITADGGYPVNPHKLCPEPVTWEQAMKIDLAELCDCDAIAMLPGWRESRGARVEHKLAKVLGLRIFPTVEAALEALNGVL